MVWMLLNMVWMLLNMVWMLLNMSFWQQNTPINTAVISTCLKKTKSK